MKFTAWKVALIPLGKCLKPDGDGWIVPPAAAEWDFGLIVLRYPPSGITPLPLFDGDKAALTAALKAADRKVTQSGYPVDHLACAVSRPRDASST